MFDYNIMGRGYRFADFRNVCSSLSNETKIIFTNEYNRLYVEKHGQTRTEADEYEQCIDNVVEPLFQLLVAFTEKKNSANRAEREKVEAMNGELLLKIIQLL